MGKGRQHTGFVTQTEWKYLYGGKKDEKRTKIVKLPFDCCALALTPWQTPVCGPSGGAVFDLLTIVPWLRRYKHHPVTGEVLHPKHLVRLLWHRNREGALHCPVTMKTFTEFSHIVAVRSGGAEGDVNVYSHEAVYDLNVKPKNWRDLLTDLPFARSDILTLQDPAAPIVGNTAAAQALASAREKLKKGVNPHSRTSAATDRVMSEAAVVRAAREERERVRAAERAAAARLKEESELDDYTRAAALEWEQSTGAPLRSELRVGHRAGSLTSTAVDVTTESSQALASVPERREHLWCRLRAVGKVALRAAKRSSGASFSAKALVQLRTTCGPLNFELHCGMAPRTCHNFLALCANGYYDGTPFHRVIRNFMVQGGDPDGSGKGGDSLWGSPFADEFDSRLGHSARGVLSMANSGSNTNKSQFFVTLKSCSHLDNKHSIFGQLVGGEATLRALETLETDDDDRPTGATLPRIVDVQIFSNPFEIGTLVALEEQAGTRPEAAAPAAAAAAPAPAASASASAAAAPRVVALPAPPAARVRPRAAAAAAAAASRAARPPTRPPQKRRKKSSFSDFSAW